jgi:uncharacterized surface protein with fasciclin (FAS1) repeats
VNQEGTDPMRSFNRRLTLLGAAGLLAAPAVLRLSPAAAQAGNPITGNTPATLLDAIRADRRLARFAQLLSRAGAEQRLREPGQWTVFAPTDSGFNWMPATVLEGLEGRTGSETQGDLSRVNTVALQHIVPFSFAAERLQGRTEELTAANGGKLRVDGTKNPIEVRAVGTAGTLGAPGANAEGPAKVVTADVFVSNGVLHVIDTVLLPS